MPARRKQSQHAFHATRGFFHDSTRRNFDAGIFNEMANQRSLDEY